MQIFTDAIDSPQDLQGGITPVSLRATCFLRCKPTGLNPSHCMSGSLHKTSGNSQRFAFILALPGSDSMFLLKCPSLCIFLLFLLCLSSTDPEVG